MGKEKYERNTSQEILRLIAMYMIVFIHANMYLGYFCAGAVNTFYNGLVNGICNVGVSCFILISGYYGIKFDVRKLIKMECMMITYSLLETFILCVAFPAEMTGSVLLEQVIKSFMPFITRKYWFYSSYICLFLLSGFIQKFIESMEQEQFKRLLLLLIGMFSMLPTLFYFEIVPDNGKGLVQMVMVYLIGRYIKLYRDIQISKGRALLGVAVLWVINGISHEFPIRIGEMSHHLCKDNSITNLLIAVMLFYLFKELKIYSYLVNRVSTYVFAVFALNNSLVTVTMEWIINIERPKNDIVGFGLLCGVVLLVFGGCLCIGAIREILFGWLDEKMGKLGQKLLEVKK